MTEFLLKHLLLVGMFECMFKNMYVSVKRATFSLLVSSGLIIFNYFVIKTKQKNIHLRIHMQITVS